MINAIKDAHTTHVYSSLMGPLLDAASQDCYLQQLSIDTGISLSDLKNYIKSGKGKFPQKMAQSRIYTQKRTGISPIEKKLIRAWVRSKCDGDSNTTILKCSLPRKKLYELYVRIGAPHIYDSLMKIELFKQKMQKFDPKTINIKRRALAQSLYLTRQWKERGWHTERPQGIWARSEKSFWRIVRQRKGRTQLLKISFCHKLHPCPQCASYQEVKREHNALTLALSKANSEDHINALKQRLSPLETKMLALKDHIDKYQCQRAELSLLEQNLHKDPGVVIVYEDFTARYQADGTKMSDLVLALRYYDKKERRVVTRYADMFSAGSLSGDKINDPKSRGKQDKYVYRDAWLKHLRGGLFNDFHTIIKSGDNGSSLKNYETFWFAGMIWEKFHKRVIWHTLCPGHAYNRCDQHAGVVNPVLDRAETELETALGTPAEHAAALNKVELKDTVPADYVVVPRQSDEFMPGDLLDEKTAMDRYGIKAVSCAYPEIPDIHDLRPNPQNTIMETGIGMVTTVLREKDQKEYNSVAFMDVRPDAAKPEKCCPKCSVKFGRIVLLSEHDQTNHWYCPTTSCYSKESSLDRFCYFCADTVENKHTRGQKNSCPSEDINLETGDHPPLETGDHPPFHQTFHARTIHGPADLSIEYKARLRPSPDQVREICAKFENIMRPKLNPVHEDWPMVETMFGIWRDETKQAKKQLPWVLGRCSKVDQGSKCYLMTVYVPDSNAKVLWNSRFTESKDQVYIPFDKALHRPVKIGKRSGKISTKTLVDLALSGNYGWTLNDLISQDDLEDVLEPEEDPLSETQVCELEDADDYTQWHPIVSTR